MKTTKVAKRIDGMAVFDYSDGMYEALKRKTAQGEEYYLGYRVKDELFVPRNLVTKYKYDARRVNPMSQAVVVKHDYRDSDQKRCAEEAVDLLKQDISFVLKAPTGWGKSYVGARIAAEMGQKTLIIVTKTDLFKSWKDSLINVLGVDPSRVGHVQGDIINWKGKDFVLATVQTVVKFEKLGVDFYNYFGMVQWDEGHRMGAEGFSLSCRLFPAKYRMALTATPKRGDGKMTLVKAHIGDVLVEGVVIPMSPKVIVVKTGWRIPKADSMGRGIHFVAGRVNTIIPYMAQAKQRNDIIIKFALDAYKKGRNHVMMGDQIEAQLQVVYGLLLGAGVDARDIGWYIGGKTEIELEQASKKKIVLTTFKMCSEGTNYPHWDTLTLLSPKASAEQMVGRINRIVEGKSQPVVLELVDNNVILQGFHKKRMTEYHRLKSDIVYMN